MNKKKLWLTYAWTDNEDRDVDYIIDELQNEGVEVRFDRAQLIPGRRLWGQIDSAFQDPGLDAWAILVTENSLRSESCQEELAIALDRALRTKGSDFPLIGLFPTAVDRALIPSAIAIRLYVNLNSADWKGQVLAGISKTAPAQKRENIRGFGFTLHTQPSGYILEVWPRLGGWSPSFASVPQSERDLLKHVMPCPRGFASGEGSCNPLGLKIEDYFTRAMSNQITSQKSMQILLKSLPSEILFGGFESGNQIVYRLTSAEILSK